MNKRKKGGEMEDLACRFLEERGLRVLHRNFRSRTGEIDIVCREKDGTLVFTEVKYRRSLDQGCPEEAVTWQKRRRIIQAASYYLVRFGLSDQTKIRFDVVAISEDALYQEAMAGSGALCFNQKEGIRWIRDAFRLGE